MTMVGWVVWGGKLQENKRNTNSSTLLETKMRSSVQQGLLGTIIVVKYQPVLE